MEWHKKYGLVATHHSQYTTNIPHTLNTPHKPVYNINQTIFQTNILFSTLALQKIINTLHKKTRYLLHKGAIKADSLLGG